jgi:hypothetical protein
LPSDYNVPPIVHEFAARFAEAHKSKLPKHYVVDIGIAKEFGPIVVELNDFMCAGNSNKEIFRKVIVEYRGC